VGVLSRRNAENTGVLHGLIYLRSKGSGVRITPGVPKPQLIGSVNLPFTSFRAIAKQQEVRERLLSIPLFILPLFSSNGSVT
jgi:hypothetical protein